MFPATLTCAAVFSEPCLTLFSGSRWGSDRIGFTLSGSSSFSTPRIFMALAFAASRSSLLSRRLRLTDRPTDRDRLLDGDRENLHRYWLTRPLDLLQRKDDLDRDLERDLEGDLYRLRCEYLAGERVNEREWAL